MLNVFFERGPNAEIFENKLFFKQTECGTRWPPSIPRIRIWVRAHLKIVKWKPEKQDVTHYSLAPKGI